MDELANTIVELQSIYFLLASSSSGSGNSSCVLVWTAQWKQAAGKKKKKGFKRGDEDAAGRLLTYTKLHHISVVRPADDQGDKNNRYPC